MNAKQMDLKKLPKFNKEQKVFLQLAHYRPEEAVKFCRRFLDEGMADEILIYCVDEQNYCSFGLSKDYTDAEVAQAERDLRKELPGMMPLGFYRELGTEKMLHLFPWWEVACVLGQAERWELIQQLMALCEDDVESRDQEAMLVN